MAWRSRRATGWICGCCLVASVALAAPPGTITPIHHIQGAGPASPLVGRTVTTRGVVTAVFPGLRGWFLQDETGDGDPRTSDGVFVFANRGPIDVAVGERIELAATVSEYAARAGRPTQTELVRPSVVARLGTGRIAPTPVALPEAVDGDLERVEGMLVTFPDPLTVSQTFFLGRHGQLTLSSGGRMTKPTQLHRPGSPEAAALAALNARRRIVLDDGRSAARTTGDAGPVPYVGRDGTVRAGDTVTGLTGVVDSGRVSGSGGIEIDYRVHPTLPPVIARMNVRPTAPPAVGGPHRVAAFNLGNWFTTFRDGTTAEGGAGQGCLPSGTTKDCRGAADARMRSSASAPGPSRPSPDSTPTSSDWSRCSATTAPRSPTWWTR
jgi:predicted extracellular nuclease